MKLFLPLNALSGLKLYFVIESFFSLAGSWARKRFVCFLKMLNLQIEHLMKSRLSFPAKGEEGWTTLSRKGRDPVGSK
ncbi:MAG TPA: hypothetical protein PK614_06085 [Nitrospira sp.]|nr:hypothetical protein [Nitrospira sp.]